jgi:sulfane dehydrogenase subunit SoxC
MGSHSHSGRRQFLTGGAALASFVMGAVRSVRGQTAAPEARPKDNLAYGQPSPFDNTIRKAPAQTSVLTDTALMTPLQDLDGIITPSGLHFLMDHVKGIPDIDPKKHRLLMHGMVDRPLEFTMDELKRLPSVSRVYSSNATQTVAHCVVRTASLSRWYTDEPAAVNGRGCCCRYCSRSAASKEGRLG